MISILEFFHHLAPSRCELCRDNLPNNDFLCSDCLGDLEKVTSCCQHCGIPMPIDCICAKCLHTAGNIDKTITAYQYNYPLDTLLKKYKYNHQLGIILPLTKTLSNKILAAGALFPEIIIPVPLHFKRQYMRGFNQALEISKQISRMTNIPIDYKIIKRIKNTAPMFELSRGERKNNLRGAFQLNHVCTYKSIALVDDIITTGSTGDEIAGLLRANGAQHVQIWAIARANK